MVLSDQLLQATERYKMLSHPFYRAWEMGELSLDTLKTYARQYFHHVNAFPRYISQTHAQCVDLPSRQVLLDNLMDEELGDGNHPRRWLRFATGLGQSETFVNNEEAFEETQALVDTFLSTAKRSYAAGLSALYIYEQQIPEVARSKEAGLRKFYGVTDDSTVDYFTLHATVDVEHSEATRRLVDTLPEDLAAEAVSGAEAASKALWSFLDKMHSVHQLPH